MRSRICFLIVFTGLHLLAGSAIGSLIISSTSVSGSQNFNTLANTGTSSTLPSGWFFSESGTSGNVNSLYAAGTGSANAGDTFSFGDASATDRAFGGLQSGTFITVIGVQITIGSGTNLNSISVSYTGEQWRLGTTGRVDRLDFQYSTNAVSLASGTWTDVNGLDFTAPVTTGTTGALNGNGSANRTTINNVAISGLNIATGSSVWFRWNDFDASGAEDGLGIDDFSVTGTFSAIPEPAALLLVGMASLMAFPRRRRG